MDTTTGVLIASRNFHGPDVMVSIRLEGAEACGSFSLLWKAQQCRAEQCFCKQGQQLCSTTSCSGHLVLSPLLSLA